MRNIIIIFLVLFAFSCSNNSTDTYTTVKVRKVEQVNTYTYLLVKAKGPEYWIAVSTMDARPGETYQYKGGLLMEDFYSKELDQTFEEVLFLDEIIAENVEESKVANQMSGMDMKDIPAHQGIKELTPGSAIVNEKSAVKISNSKGGISIADLFSDPDSFKGKTIRIKGEVTKVNNAIMERNWVHLQDGTEHEGRYDLTVTTSENFEKGTIVTVEGILAVDIDFGYGYSYEILLEKATKVE